MKRSVFILASSFALPAMAQPAPKTVIMPSVLMDAIAQHLQTEPYNQVAGLIAMMNACKQVQTPDDNGAIRDMGQCPPVSSELHPAAAHATGPASASIPATPPLAEMPGSQAPVAK